jgi:hypothetical protein
MTALTAASWTVTITESWIAQKKRWVQGTLLLAGTDTYPDNGIPMPAIGVLGFVRNLDGITLFGVDAAAGTVADYMPRYDKVNHKLFLFEEEATAAGGPLLEADTSEVPGARTYNYLAWGW